MIQALNILKALADRNRLRIVTALNQHDELCACQITERGGNHPEQKDRDDGLLPDQRVRRCGDCEAGYGKRHRDIWQRAQRRSGGSPPNERVRQSDAVIAHARPFHLALT